MGSKKEYELKEQLREIQGLEGRGTELVSLYIPPGKSIRQVQGQVENEYAQAENIKSDRTQESVQSALKKIKNILQSYKKTPENGLAVFVGRANGDLRQFVFDDLPRPVSSSRYVCSDQFATDDLESIIAPDSAYGLIVLDRNEATIGRLIGDRIEIDRYMESGVMGKSKAGGQSAARFERVRMKQKEEFFKKVASSAEDLFIDEDGLMVDAILLGGTSITVDDFINGEFLDYRLRDGMIGSFNVGYGNQQGLNELVDKAEDVLSEYEELEAKKYMDRFYEGITDDDKSVTYGQEKVEKAIEYGAVDILLLSEKLDSEVVDELDKLVSQQGGETVMIPTSFERGFALWDTFGGIAAILRYEVFEN